MRKMTKKFRMNEFGKNILGRFFKNFGRHNAMYFYSSLYLLILYIHRLLFILGVFGQTFLQMIVTVDENDC